MLRTEGGSEFFWKSGADVTLLLTRLHRSGPQGDHDAGPAQASRWRQEPAHEGSRWSRRGRRQVDRRTLGSGEALDQLNASAIRPTRPLPVPSTAPHPRDDDVAR